jgi:hypothetical protein
MSCASERLAEEALGGGGELGEGLLGVARGISADLQPDGILDIAPLCQREACGGFGPERRGLGEGLGSGGGSESLVTCQQRSGERRHLRGDQRHIGKSEAGEARPDRSLELGLH